MLILTRPSGHLIDLVWKLVTALLPLDAVVEIKFTQITLNDTKCIT
jgi:hypothetical protein